MTAWERADSIPAEPLPWLLVVARNKIANHRRAEGRKGRLASALAQLHYVVDASTAADEAAEAREQLVTALAGLTMQQREALLLVAWDQLSIADAAQVAGCSRASFDVRLHRARRRLARAWRAEADPPAGGSSLAPNPGVQA